MNLLEVQNISYTYDGQRLALKNISAVFERGHVYAISGPAGCGKTTLISLLGGLDIPDSGQLLYKGHLLDKRNLTEYRRSQSAFIFQSHNLIEYMTPSENVSLMSDLPPLPILGRVGITPEESRLPLYKLSPGQKRRIAIARALASNASIILADEPTSSLDEQAAAVMIKLLQESAHRIQKCVIFATRSEIIAQEADCIFSLSP